MLLMQLKFNIGLYQKGISYYLIKCADNLKILALIGKHATLIIACMDEWFHVMNSYAFYPIYKTLAERKICKRSGSKKLPILILWSYFKHILALIKLINLLKKMTFEWLSIK